MSQYKGAIFDLDGTLLDSMGIWSQIDIDFLAKRGFEVPEDYQKSITPLGADAAAVYTIERFGLKEKPEDLVREWLDMAHDAYAHTIPLKKYAFSYVKSLYDKGIPMAIATSSEQSLVLPCLERTGLLPMLNAVVTVAEVSRGKGYPDIYEEAARRIGQEAESCLVFEDIIEGVRGAKLGGFTTVGVYEPGYLAEAELRTEADRYILSFSELIDQDIF